MENLGVFPHRGFIAELDPAAVSVKVSEMFLEEFGRRLTHTCMFRDPAGSRFNVLMYNMYGEDHFTTSLASLRAHYNLHQGGWVNMFYLGASEFYLKVLDRELREVNYRDFPVVNLKVGWQDSDEEVADVESEPEDDHADYFRGRSFTIKASHLTSHTKAIPADLVRLAIHPNKPACCVLRDDLTRRFFCEMRWGKSNNSACYISKGWHDFVVTNGLVKGDFVSFGIERRDPALIHVSVVRRLVNQLRSHP